MPPGKNAKARLDAGNRADHVTVERTPTTDFIEAQVDCELWHAWRDFARHLALKFAVSGDSQDLRVLLQHIRRMAWQSIAWRFRSRLRAKRVAS